WELPRRVAEFLGMAHAQPPQNWLTGNDIENRLDLSGFEGVRTGAEILCPVYAPLFAAFANRYLLKLWPVRLFELTYSFVSRFKPRGGRARTPVPLEPVVSVIVPARNEEGNIAAIFDRVPEMGGGTELIFVEGNSRDGTWTAIEHEIARRRRRNVK